MKIFLTPTDKKTIIEGLKSNHYPINQLNHLSQHIRDHTRAIELAPDFVLPVTTLDKRNLLKSLKRGFIDFEYLPDLTKEISISLFMRMMLSAGRREKKQ